MSHGAAGYLEVTGLRHFAFEVDAIGPVRAALVAKSVQGEPIRADPYTGWAMMFLTDPDVAAGTLRTLTRRRLRSVAKVP